MPHDRCVSRRATWQDRLRPTGPVSASGPRPRRAFCAVVTGILCAAAFAVCAGRVTAGDRTETGIASVYSLTLSRTASGVRLVPTALTAAHRSLPFGTLVRVTNVRNGRSVVVRITDRGPFIRGRIIDVTPAAAQALGFSGLARVTVTVVTRDVGPRDSPRGTPACGAGECVATTPRAVSR